MRPKTLTLLAVCLILSAISLPTAIPPWLNAPRAAHAQSITAPLTQEAEPARPQPPTVAARTLDQWRQAWRNDAAFNAFTFRNPLMGLAVGDAGRIALTADGGQSWQMADQPQTAWHLQTAAWADDETIYAAGGRRIGPLIGSTGGVLMSRDRGRTWQRRLEVPRRVWTVLANGRHVLACCTSDADLPSGLLASADTGATWSPVAADETPALAAPVITGQWVSDIAALLVTADGRLLLYNPAAQEALREVAALDMTISAAAVRSLNHWFVAAQDGTIRRTEDGGRTWRLSTVTPEPLPGEIRHFSFTGQGRIAWALAAGGRPAYFTRDGGVSWQALGSSPGVPVRAMHFSDAWNGLAAGAFGSIYRTTDGGSSWEAVAGEQKRPAILLINPLNDTADLPLVSMLAGDRGYRTILWYATRPADRREPLIVAERRLRDALLPHWGAAGLLLASQPSSLRQGPPLFNLNPGRRNMPFDDADQFNLSVNLVRQAISALQPAIVISPDSAANNNDDETPFVGRVVRQAIPQHPGHWIRGGGLQPQRPPLNADDSPPPDDDRQPQPATEQNSTAAPVAATDEIAPPPAAPAALPADSDEAAAIAAGWHFMTADPLMPSEIHGLHHALLTAEAAETFNQHPPALPATVRYGLQKSPDESQDEPQETPENSGAQLMLERLQENAAMTRRQGPQVAVVPLSERRQGHEAARRLMTALSVALDRAELERALEMVEDVARAASAQPDSDPRSPSVIARTWMFHLARFAAMHVARQAALSGREDIAMRAFAAIEPDADINWQQLNRSPENRWANRILESMLWRMQTLKSLELQLIRAADAAAARTANAEEDANNTPVGATDEETAESRITVPRLPVLTQQQLASELAARQNQVETLTGRADPGRLALLRLTVETDPAERAALLARLSETLEELPPELLWPARLHLWLATDRSQPAPLPMIPLRRRPIDGLLQGSAEVAPGVTVQVIEQASALNVLVNRQLAATGEFWLTFDFDGDGSTLLVEPLMIAPTSDAAASADRTADAVNNLAVAVAAPVWLRLTDAFQREAMGNQFALRLRYDAVGGRPGRGSVWILSLRRQQPHLQRPRPWPASDGSQGFFAIIFE